VPSPGIGMPLNSMNSEDIKKMPWLVMGFELSEIPIWEVFDPANFAMWTHGSGDILELLLQLNKAKVEYDLSNVYHNFFWPKNLDKKGFERLVKDEEPPSKERERERAIIN
jgi:hypothetical protein